jgi:hypothetical protein
LKKKLVTAPILIFPDWKKEFHIHMDKSFVDLGEILAHSGEGDIDHPIEFERRKLSNSKHNYTMTKCEGLAMVYVLHKFKHYFLGLHFMMYIFHSALIYLVNKLVLWGIICRWLLLFQEYEFEVIVKPEKFNSRPDHLSHILS